MYLAIKEMMYNKLRYSLVIGIIFLITYMIFFMTSLGNGLIRDNRVAVDNWHASSAILSEYANHNLTASFISENDYKNHLSKEQVPVGYMAAVINKKDSTEKKNISIFGQSWDSFIAPKLISGHYPKNSHEIVVDESIQHFNVHLGDTIQLNGSDTNYQVVGLTSNNKFFTSAVVYTDLPTYWQLRFGTDKVKTISAIVQKTDQPIDAKNLEQLTIDKMIANLPGYTPELNVFAGMVISLVVITGLIIGIFVYIMTIQKINLYGVMRAQGIQSKTIITSLFSQILILSIISIGLALICVLLTKATLPPTMFFYINWQFYALLSLMVIVMALLGGLISLPKILRIDPLTAIGE